MALVDNEILDIEREPFRETGCMPVSAKSVFERIVDSGLVVPLTGEESLAAIEGIMSIVGEYRSSITLIIDGQNARFIERGTDAP